MTIRSHPSVKMLLAALLAIEQAACGEVTDRVGASGFDEAEAANIDRALTPNPNDPIANRWAEEFNARADAQLGLLETVEFGPGHSVNFY